MGDPAAAIMAVAFFGSIAISVRSVANVFARRADARRQQPLESAEVAERLARIEAAVDVIAVEVERIAEAQRFALKLAEGQPATPRLGKPAGGEGRATAEPLLRATPP